MEMREMPLLPTLHRLYDYDEFLSQLMRRDIHGRSRVLHADLAEEGKSPDCAERERGREWSAPLA